MSNEISFSFKVEEVLNPLKNVVSIIPSNSLFPVLSAMRIKLNRKNWEFFGTDMNNTILYRSDKVTIVEGGEILIPGKLFYDILKNIEGEVEITVKDDFLFGSYKPGKFKIPLMDLESYPQKPEIKSETYKIDSLKLKDKIKDLLFLVSSSNNSRRCISGMYWEYKKGVLTLVSTDSFAMGYSSIALDLGEQDFQILVHSNILSQFIANESKEMGVSINENEIIFSDVQYTLISQLIKSDFVDWKNVMFKGKANHIKIGKDLLEDCLKRISTFCTTEPKGVVLLPEGDNIIISSDETPMGKAVETLSLLSNKGKSVEKIVLSITYLQNIIKRLKGTEANIEIFGENVPVKIFEKGNRVEYYLMPIRK